MAKRTELLYGGCRLVEIWECNFQECFKENEEMKTHLKKHPLTLKEPMDPPEMLLMEGERMLQNFTIEQKKKSGKKINI
ncbi:hypothetical protein J437_LFUL018334 [Ladona fulva]|uniref:Uncharacterized protein n=1 Tax=Ladona fulva TaxID=123851 RepID=A0A8K0KRE1_LADFU|nr:hypothetical protein J437_LFUL018334 [Ladona fulva]